MPTKWNAKRDSILLAKILKAHPTLQINADMMAKSWPADDEHPPNARSIRDHFNKIKREAGVDGKTAKIAGNSAIKDIDTQNSPEEEDDSVVDKDDPMDRSSFLQSSFNTKYKKPRTKENSENKKRRNEMFSDEEEEALSSSGSDSEIPPIGQIVGKTPSKVNSTQKRKLRASLVPKKYTFNNSEDEALGMDRESEDSDDSYDLAREREKEDELEEKRSLRVERVARRCSSLDN